MESRNEYFETNLNQARVTLDEARDRYRSVEGGVPDEFVEALQGFESRLEELEGVGRISDDDLEEAELINRRIDLLSELLESLSQHDADIVEYDVQRQRLWVERLLELANDADAHSLRSDVSGQASNVDLFETLIEAGKHSQVRSNDQFTLSDVECELRTVDTRLRDTVDSETCCEVYLNGVEEFVDRIHELLRELRETNPERTVFGDQLQKIKSLKESAREEANATDARVAFEGAMMVYVSVYQGVCRQEHADRLADAIQRHDLSSEEDPNELAQSVDVDTLISVIASGVSEEVDESRATRLRRLLSEHDGSVRRTVDATEFDSDEIFELLQSMYEAEESMEITVEFEQ